MAKCQMNIRLCWVGVRLAGLIGISGGDILRRLSGRFGLAVGVRGLGWPGRRSLGGEGGGGVGGGRMPVEDRGRWVRFDGQQLREVRAKALGRVWDD